MTSLTHPSGRVFSRFAHLIPHRIAGRSRTSMSASSSEETRARRDFVSDVIAKNPEAFSSELDVQTMMLFYSDRR